MNHPITPTPGAWTIVPEQATRGKRTFVVAESGFAVAVIPSRAWEGKPDTASLAQDIANARLIVSAKALALMVRELLDHDDGHDDDDRGSCIFSVETRARAEALLAACGITQEII